MFSHLADFGASHPKIRQEMRSGDKSPATDQAVDDAEWKTAKKLCQMLQLSNDAQSNIYQHLKRRKEYLMTTFSLFFAETFSQVNSNFYTQLEAIASQFGKNKFNMLPDDAAFDGLCRGVGVGSSYNLGQVEFDSDELRATKKQRTATREDELAINISFMGLLFQSDDLQCELSLQTPNDILIHRGCSIRADDVDRVEPNMPVNSTGFATAVSSSQVRPSVALYQNNSWAVTSSRETGDHHTDATRSVIDSVPSLDLRLDILHSGSTMATVSAIDCNATAAQSNDLLMKTPSIESSNTSPSYWHLGEEARKISSSRNKLLQDYFAFEKDTRFTDDINL